MTSSLKNTCASLAAGVIASLFIASTASAQSAIHNHPSSFEASPEVYKLLFEDSHFRVIMAVWKPGQRDAMHSHPGVLVNYRFTDCKLQATFPDGKSQIRDTKKGEVGSNPALSHSVQNIGNGDCQLLIIERK
jgi:hypothetical protein